MNCDRCSASDDGLGPDSGWLKVETFDVTHEPKAEAYLCQKCVDGLFGYLNGKEVQA